MSRRIELLLEIIFLILIFLNSFLLFISIFLPIRPDAFETIIYLDLIASIALLFGYLLQIRRQKKNVFIKKNWNGFISITPFYFIGIVLLGMDEASLVLKILCFIKIFALIMSGRQVGRAVDEFVEKSRLVYGFTFFVVVLVVCSVAFFVVEQGVNPEVTTFEDSLWYVIQTITTVGYGDVVPDTQWGRVIGVLAMISAIGISSLLTAATTSSLMDKFRQEREALKEQSEDYVHRLEEKVDLLNSEMAKRNYLDDVTHDVQDIKSEIEELKELIKKKID
ncbi:MAG: ion channel [Methanobacteriaceae archaeon]|nr:ion channel [Methanobacteriaceae archaeon]